MQPILHMFAMTWAKTPHPLRSLLSFLALPVVIPVVVINLIRNTDFAALSVDGMGFARLQELLKVEERTEDESGDAAEDLAERTQGWLDAGDWDSFSTTLWEMDRTGAKTKAGDHLSKEMMGAVWAHVTKGIPKIKDECGETLTKPIPLERLEPFMDAAAAYPKNPAIHALAAWLCLQVGWVYRGADYANYVSDEQFEKMNTMFQTADAFLDRFDAEEVGSPMLARVKYHRTAGVNTTLQNLTAAFETCMRLDPDDLSLMSDHAFHLLPRWYGNYDILDDQARRAYARTNQTRGATDYAAFYIDQIEADDGALATVDLDLFEQGLKDWVAWSDTPQETLNTILGRLSRVVFGSFGFAATPAIVKRQRKVVASIFKTLVKEHLDALIVKRWGTNRREAYYAIARAYIPELDKGETVYVGASVAD